MNRTIKKYRKLIVVICLVIFIGAVILVCGRIHDRRPGKRMEQGDPDSAQDISMPEQTSELSGTQQVIGEKLQEASLESEETWVDVLYNNIVTGNYQPVVDLMMNDSAFLEAYDAAYDADDGLITSSGHWVGFHEVWGDEGCYDRSIYVAVPEWEQNKKEKRALGIRSEYYFVNYFRGEGTETWSYYKEISYMDSHDEDIILAQGSL